MTTPALLPTIFRVPLVNPSPGLYAATTWTEDDEERWLSSGVEFWPMNYSGDAQSGVWDVPWCGDPGDNVKSGDRPDDVFLDPFAPLVVWAWDHEQCRNAMSVDPAAQQEVRDRVLQVLRLREQREVERAFAARGLADAGTPDTAFDIVGAVGRIEDLFADTGMLGLVHASPVWAASAAQAQLLVRTGGALKTPMGHTWVFGAGYSSGLGDTLLATRPTFGWRGQVRLNDDFDPNKAEYVALAEREIVVGYEGVVGAVTVTPVIP